MVVQRRGLAYPAAHPDMWADQFRACSSGSSAWSYTARPTASRSPRGRSARSRRSARFSRFAHLQPDICALAAAKETITTAKVASSLVILAGAITCTIGAPTGVKVNFTDRDIVELFRAHAGFVAALVSTMAAGLALIVVVEVRYPSRLGGAARARRTRSRPQPTGGRAAADAAGVDRASAGDRLPGRARPRRGERRPDDPRVELDARACARRERGLRRLRHARLLGEPSSRGRSSPSAARSLWMPSCTSGSR